MIFKKFENFITNKPEINSSILNNQQIEKVKINTYDYVKRLDSYEKQKLKQELEKFAKEHGYLLDDLKNPQIVQSILTNSNESWFSDNWLNIVNKLTKYLRIGSIVTFLGSLMGYYATGADTSTVMKVAIGAFVISNIVACLKGLEGID